MKKAFLLMIVASAAIAAAGCNTVRGAGQDIERAGESIQDATN